MGFITINNSAEGVIKSIQILGNTVQNQSNLSDIKSVGTPTEDGRFKMSILSCNKNLLDKKALGSFVEGFRIGTDGTTYNKEGYKMSKDFMDIPSFLLNKELVFGFDGCIAFYSSNEPKTLISRHFYNSSFRVPSNAKYFKVDFKNELENKLQLEEGTVATQYEPHKETKNTILLPCQLEKVGDVSDRLYYDEVEKAWCVEKVPKDKLLVGEEGWVKENADLTNTLLFGLDISDIKRVATTSTLANLLCNRFKVKISSSQGTWGTDEEGVSVNPNGRFHIRIAKSKATDLTTFKQWLSQNNTLIKYELVNPQKIVLPLDTQIALNSFANKTHIYTLDTEIEPTVKAKVSKSLGASVQSLNVKTDSLKDRIEAIEGLKESQDMQYETDKGYLICEETQNGVVKDLKIKGKTLVNLFNNSTAIVQADSNRLRCANAENINMYKPTIYTLVNLSDKVIEPNVWKQSVAEFIRTISLQANEVTTVTLGSDECIREVVWNYLRGWTEGDLEKAKKSLIILEGDHTQNSPNGYIDGLQSVGEDIDKIEVLTRKEDGNLFDGEFVANKVIEGTTGEIRDSNERCITKNRIFVQKGDKIYFRINSSQQGGVIKIRELYFYDKLGKYLGKQGSYITDEIITIDFEGYMQLSIMFATSNIEGLVDISKIDLVIVKSDSKVTNVLPYRQHKKEILYKDTDDTYKPVPALMEWDEIDDTKGKWYKRSEKVVLNGSENWNTASPLTNSIMFVLNKSDIAIGGNVISDKFKSEISNNVASIDADAISSSGVGNKILIRISKSKLGIVEGDTNGVILQKFKTWLQANNVTVVYQLAEEQFYDIAPINLDTYSNKTMVCCSSGAINPHMSFAITSYITNLIQSNKERINKLESEIYKYVVSQNSMMLTTRYSADTTDFKLETLRNQSDVINVVYDEKLFDLILNNIVVGKENYERTWIEELITFYYMDFKLSDEMFMGLMNLIEGQHTSPVIETPVI